MENGTRHLFDWRICFLSLSLSISISVTLILSNQRLPGVDSYYRIWEFGDILPDHVPSLIHLRLARLSSKVKTHLTWKYGAILSLSPPAGSPTHFLTHDFLSHCDTHMHTKREEKEREKLSQTHILLMSDVLESSGRRRAILRRPHFILDSKLKPNIDELAERERDGESSLPFDQCEMAFLHYIPSQSRLIVILRSPQYLPKKRRVFLPLIAQTIDSWIGDCYPHATAETGFTWWIACTSCLEVR
jgi:hypothetical protein